MGVKKRDFWLIGSILLLAVLVLICLWLFSPKGSTVEVWVDGQLSATLPLNTDTTYAIGDGNVLVIEGGRVCMQSASCPDQICVRHAPVSRAGNSIICLPNRITLKVTGADAVDGVGG